MFNLKKMAIAFFVFSCGASFSGAMGQLMEANNPKENLYAGVGVGGSFNDDQLETQNVVFGSTVNAASNNNQWVGNVFLGYGHTFMNSLFLGIEANTYFPHRTENFYSPGVTIVGPIYQDQLAINDYLGLDLLPGYRVNSDLLIYGRAGLSFRDVSINQPENTPNSPSFFNSDNSVGGRFGAGITYALNRHIAASVDYYYSYFPTFSSNWPLFNLQYNFKSHSNYAGFSLLYTV
ncbi:outer membrane protein [Legionella maioricensis]|uniref:Outer membrane beta-barrel protein n=1 Tax=Legionella maioricensis TaxID=2896528 RepID=A0A9X2IDT5_9GAMM|nr:outer membrane beta-barrel protein [Legionella maioricensis]MCL9685118.1 outer membrane beta-barrel protein [Legionella maioricensis]MCL9688369.1 outer membrane beta-barrel protein [Legionella maioricensis]